MYPSVYLWFEASFCSPGWPWICADPPALASWVQVWTIILLWKRTILDCRNTFTKKALTVKPDDPNFILRSHMLEGGSRLSQVVFCHMHAHTFTHTHTVFCHTCICTHPHTVFCHTQTHNLSHTHSDTHTYCLLSHAHTLSSDACTCTYTHVTHAHTHTVLRMHAHCLLSCVHAHTHCLLSHMHSCTHARAHTHCLLSHLHARLIF